MAKSLTYLVGVIDKNLDILHSRLEGVSLNRFAEDPLLLDAVRFRLAQILQAALSIKDKDKAKFPNIQWIKLKLIRNHIVHSADKVSPEELYKLAVNDVYELQKQLKGNG